MSLGKIIRHRRKELGFTQDQVATGAGISKPYLSNIETGRVKNPPTDMVLGALERALQVDSGQLTRLGHLERTPPDVRDENELLAAQVNKLRSVVKGLLDSDGADSPDANALRQMFDSPPEVPAGLLVPVINRVSAGYPESFTDLDYPAGVAEEYIRCPDLHDPQAFGAYVAGDSMAPKYQEGDLVVFSPNTHPESGNDCFVRFADDAGTSFKRFFCDDPQTIRLQPINNRYPSQTFDVDQITGLWPAVYRIEKLRA